MTTLYYLLILVVGGFLSYKNIIPKKIYPHLEKIQLAALIIMLLSMGLKMGMDENVIKSFLTIGFHSIIFALATVIGSIIFVVLFTKIANLFRKSEQGESAAVKAENADTSEKKDSNLMSVILVAIVAVGVLLGTMLNSKYIPTAETFLQFGLYLLLFFTGIDIGKKNIFAEVKSIKLLFVLIPVAIVIGTLLVAYLLGFVLHYPAGESAAVGAGFGWYSLSAVIISPYSDTLAALAFMSNVMREILAIIFVPFIAKYISFEAAVGACGATGMDTLLPIVSRNTNARTAVLSFTTGVILSSIVPLLLPLLLGI